LREHDQSLIHLFTVYKLIIVCRKALNDTDGSYSSKDMLDRHVAWTSCQHIANIAPSHPSSYSVRVEHVLSGHPILK